MTTTAQQLRTYLDTKQLAEKIHYKPRTIRDCLIDNVLIEGVHYFRPFGGRKILFIWEAIERDMVSTTDSIAIPMAGGNVCRV